MKIVVDAAMTAALFLNLRYSALAETHFRQWRKNGDRIHVPAIWPAEIVSFLNQAVKNSQIQAADALSVLDTLPDLHIQVAGPDPKLLETSFLWSSGNDEVSARDAQYLALAERLGAQFWTPDRKLVRIVAAQHVDWARCCNED